jgi:hypothetical protein
MEYIYLLTVKTSVILLSIKFYILVKSEKQWNDTMTSQEIVTIVFLLKNIVSEKIDNGTLKLCKKNVYMFLISHN